MRNWKPVLLVVVPKSNWDASGIIDSSAVHLPIYCIEHSAMALKQAHIPWASSEKDCEGLERSERSWSVVCGRLRGYG